MPSTSDSVDHAKRRIDDYRCELDQFAKQDPFTQLIELSADGKEDHHKVKLRKHLPVVLSFLASEVIHTLRAALDHMGYESAQGAKKSGKHAHFPFGLSHEDIESRRPSGKSKEIPDDVFAVMLSFRPFKGGNDLLWALNRLCNRQKHEMLTPMGIYVGESQMNYSSGQGTISWDLPLRWNIEKEEMLLARLTHGTPFNFEVRVHTCVTFAKLEVLAGRPADGVMENLVHLVSSIGDAVQKVRNSTR